jgi:geranylgeranyl reductase family protein
VDADVMVVGAGPAGASAACALARRGVDVLLIDRKEFPRDKTCGDGVPPGSIEILNDLGMGDKIRAAGFYPIHGIRIGAPAGRTWETSFRAKRDGAQFYVAPRAQFDSLIQSHAVESGARFLQGGVKAPIEENGRVTGVRAVANGRAAELRSQVVIGADGATSAVARALRPTTRSPEHHRSIAIRAYVDGIETLPNRVEFYFYKRFVPGYGWVFPLGRERANVGVVMRADKYRSAGASLRELMTEFLASPAVASRLRPGHRVDNVESWQLPNGAVDRFRNAFDGALLVGDAASLVDPLTGEGIHNALVSAKIAAEVIGGAIERGDTSMKSLSEYDRRCGRVLGPPLRRSYRIQSWVARAPWWVDLLFSMADAAPRQFEAFLNRMSSDFVVRVDG